MCRVVQNREGGYGIRDCGLAASLVPVRGRPAGDQPLGGRDPEDRRRDGDEPLLEQSADLTNSEGQ